MLTLIVKATEYCNASCIYCAVRDKETKKIKMGVPLLRTMMERIRDYLQVSPERRVHVTWHGGEPALMGAEYYAAVRALQQEVLGGAAGRLGHGMQTNLTLMTEEIADELVGLGVKSVGTSFDWMPGIRGVGPERDSAAYERQFLAGFEVLRSRGIAAGAIFVVTSRTVDKPIETMIFLGNLQGNALRGHFRINSLYREGEASKDMAADLAITPEQFGHFLGKAYQWWYPRRRSLIHVAPFAAVRAAVEGEPASLSCEEVGVCGNTHLSISPSGEIFQCGRAMDNDVLRFGNIKDVSFDDAFATPLKRDLVQRPAHLRLGECAGCELWDYCHGGCPVDSFIYQQDWRHKTNFCRARQVFLGEYVLPLRDAARKAAGKVTEHADANRPPAA